MSPFLNRNGLLGATGERIEYNTYQLVVDFPEEDKTLTTSVTERHSKSVNEPITHSTARRHPSEVESRTTSQGDRLPLSSAFIRGVEDKGLRWPRSLRARDAVPDSPSTILLSTQERKPCLA